MDERSLASVLKLEGSGLRNLSGQRYRAIVVPSLSAVSLAALDRLQAFAKAGGRVIFLGEAVLSLPLVPLSLFSARFWRFVRDYHSWHEKRKSNYWAGLVLDRAGLLVLDATPAVTVRVEGAGRLIGLDTGDLSYGGLFKTDTRKAYQGRLLATVQRTAPTGQVRLTAAAPGMPTAEKGGNP